MAADNKTLGRFQLVCHCIVLFVYEVILHVQYTCTCMYCDHLQCCVHSSVVLV